MFAFYLPIKSLLQISILAQAILLPINHHRAVAGPLVAEENWTEDIDAAIETANKTNRDLLLLYTGSDWCPPCQKLESEVLARKEFLNEITEKYVLVKFDFPRNSPQDETIAEQNKVWAEKFGVDQFPTVILADKNAKPFAIAGYEAGGFENYLGMLEESRRLRITRDEKLKLAEGKQGLEKAQLLDEAISEIREEIIELYYPEIVAEIIELDKEDELGLRTKWNSTQEAEMRKVIMTDIMMVSRLEKPAGAIAFIDEVLEQIEFPAKDRLEILQIKLNLVKQLEDPKQTDALLDQMMELDGVTPATRERLLVKKIYLMIGSGRRDEALQLLEKALSSDGKNLFLWMAKGEILDANHQHADAIAAYEAAIVSAADSPDVLIDLVSAKADAQYSLKQAAEALQTLDNYSEDKRQPADLRAEALLHKSLIMRDMGRIRQARLAENRAIEVCESPEQRAAMQKIVEQMRAKFGE